MFVCTLLCVGIAACSESPGGEEPGSGDGMPGGEGGKQPEETTYLYPFGEEVTGTTAEITLRTDGKVDLNSLTTEIPCLKYNKEWLFLLTQDDCKQAAYSCTWAAIHGKPLSPGYYYDAGHLREGDLPPDAFRLGKTLGCTDGCGREVRFAFTTTLAPENPYMNVPADVRPGFTDNYYRFYMKSGLIWEDVKEILNYGGGIAFHDVMAEDVNQVDSLLKHYGIAQQIIREKLSGRGCKMLAEPNGNKSYVTAALDYGEIQTLTAQAGTIILYPFQVESDLYKVLLNRVFYNTPEQVKEAIAKQLKQGKKLRQAIHLGIHGTDENWAKFLLWLNDTYGKDGDDSVWFPNPEEYYEYNYNRIHARIEKTVQENVLKLAIVLPAGQDFYYPSLTVNIRGLKKENIVSVSSGESVTGFSYGNYEEGIMLNVDCRKFLVSHAAHFVDRYERRRSSSELEDARYFVNMLKNGEEKNNLLKRIR